jgi:hypothetical protein
LTQEWKQIPKHVVQRLLALAPRPRSLEEANALGIDLREIAHFQMTLSVKKRT